MAQLPKHFAGKVSHQNRHQTKTKAKEVKILNTEPNELQDTDDTALILKFLMAASAFKSALKNLKNVNYETSGLPKKDFLKVLGDVANMVKLKILQLRAQKNNIQGESSKTQDTQCSTQSNTQCSTQSNTQCSTQSNTQCSTQSNTQCSTQSNTQSLLSFQSELSSKKSSFPGCIRNDSIDSESEAFSTSRLMSLSKQSLCSTKSSLSGQLDDDDDDDDFDYKDEKFKEFLVNVNCPFCLKRVGSKSGLVIHLDKACTTFKDKKFVESMNCPYSVFQILPNSAFKCNICPNSVHFSIKKYFAHLQSMMHMSNFNKAASHKNYSEFIFCAPCKIQVPNNATQILFHLEHRVHQKSAKDQPSTNFFRQKGIQCIYNKEKKFKCLNCPSAQSVHKSLKEILQHLESEAHVKLVLSQKNKPRNGSAVYCMFCLTEVNVFNVIGHFNSSKHEEKEKEKNCKFECCFFCGFECSNKRELALHMEDCTALDLVRQEACHQEIEEVDASLKQIETEQERTTNEKTSEKGRCIIVKDYPKIPALYLYFNKLGEVLEIEQSGKNAVMIKFREEKTVDQILESGENIEINGVKLKITRKEDFDSSETTSGGSETAGNTVSCPEANDDGRDLSLASHDVVDVSNSTVHENFYEAAGFGDTIESLFNRVSSHLSHTALKADCKDFLNIASDCEQVLKLGKCHSVGFLKCGLAFPVEKITLYCELSDSLMKEQSADETTLSESTVFNEFMCKKCISLFKNTDLVSRVSLRKKSLPLVEFYHNKTQKLCTITFRQSDNVLAEELSYHLKDNKKLHSFVLIVRFWLSVQRLGIGEFESVIISLLLFFLLSSRVVRRPSEKFSKKSGHVLINIAVTDTGYIGSYQNNRKNNSVVEMFQNFLLFLHQFDFENMAICLPLAYPVPKTVLLEGRFKKYLSISHTSVSTVCIIDPFLFNNLAVDVEKADWDSLMKTVRETIEHYQIS